MPAHSWTSVRTSIPECPVQTLMSKEPDAPRLCHLRMDLASKWWTASHCWGKTLSSPQCSMNKVFQPGCWGQTLFLGPREYWALLFLNFGSDPFPGPDWFPCPYVLISTQLNTQGGPQAELQGSPLAQITCLMHCPGNSGYLCVLDSSSSAQLRESSGLSLRSPSVSSSLETLSRQWAGSHSVYFLPSFAWDPVS